VDAVFATMERDVSSGGGVLAAALAFRIFIFLVPFVFVIVTAVPFAGDATDTDTAELADKFGMAGLASTAINSADNLSSWHRLTLLVAGIFALVLASRSLVRVLRITHGLAWNTRVPRLQKPTRAALGLILVVLALVLFNAAASGIDIGVIGIVPAVVTGLVVVALWVFVQDHLPHQDVTWKEQLPGAVLVAVGVEGLQLLTVLWFTRYIESKSETYGAIGAALAILLWAYFLGRIIVSGAMLNAVLWEQEQRGVVRRRTGRARRSAPPGPEEDHDPGREHRDDDRFDVEGQVGVEREEHEDRPAQ
jgi:membrane protein